MNSGEALYAEKTFSQFSLLKGGIIPKIGLQSTIDKPDSVRRVNPPIIIIKKVKKVKKKSHIATLFWFLVVVT